MDNPKPFDLLVSDRAVRTIFAQSIYAAYKPNPFTVKLRRLVFFETTNHITHDDRSII